MKILRAAVFALLLSLPAVVSATDECSTLASNIALLTGESYDLMEVIDDLDAAIAAPEWNPTTDGWMVDARGWAADDLVDNMNQVAAWKDYARTL